MCKPSFTSALLVAVSVVAFALPDASEKSESSTLKRRRADVKVDRNIDTGNVEVKTERK